MLIACANGGGDTGGGPYLDDSDAGSLEASADGAPGDGGADTGRSADTGTPSDSGTTPQDSGTPSDSGSPSGDSSTPGDSSMPTDAPHDVFIPDGGCPGHGTTGILATFDLSSQPGSETSAPATSSAPGVTAGAISRAAALSAVSGSGSINASGWGTGSSADSSRYYTFTLTPAAGCSMALTSLALDTQASATGPKNGDVATSADAFGAHGTSFSATGTTNVTLSVSSTPGAVEVRVYGYGASGTGGTFRIQNTMTVSGSLL